MTGPVFSSDTPKNPEKGTVILLLGPSGSGKTSIQKAFQQIAMPDLWIKIGIDSLFDLPMPDITPDNMDLWKTPNAIRWVESSEDSEGCPVISLQVGPEGEKVAMAMNSAITAYAENGCNVIVDYIPYKSSWLLDLQEKLSSITTYLVGIKISLETLEQREKSRGTSPVGHARSHYKSAYGDFSLDLEVSSEEETPEEIAEKILAKVKCQFNEKALAFLGKGKVESTLPLGAVAQVVRAADS